MIKGLIFDYNGTLLFDFEANKAAWQTIYKEIFNTLDGYENIFNKRMPTNRVIYKELFNKANIKYDEKMIEEWTYKKENLYQDYCIKHNINGLSPGAKEVLDYAKKNNIKLNMCTASVKYNVDFYMKNSNLYNYFDVNKAAYDDGKVEDKIQMYKDAAKNIGLNIKECIIFEDSKIGIDDCIAAGADKVIRINKNNNPKLNYKEILMEIEDFTKLDYSILHN